MLYIKRQKKRVKPLSHELKKIYVGGGEGGREGEKKTKQNNVLPFLC